MFSSYNFQSSPKCFFGPVSLAVIILTIHAANLSAKSPQSIDEAKKCFVFVENINKSGKVHARGSGFVAEVAGEQWIYTNAHVIEGASQVKFIDYTGRRISGLGEFQCYATGSGSFKLKSLVDTASNRTNTDESSLISAGGDGVRVKLKTKRKLALQVIRSNHQISKGDKVVTIGDNGGDETIEVLHGKISAYDTKGVLTDCETKPGSSGGALLDAETFKVMGLNTWGYRGGRNLKDIIEGKPARKYAGASLLSSVKWEAIKASHFLKFSEEVASLEEDVKVMIALYLLAPSKNGIEIQDLNSEIFEGVTYAEFLNGLMHRDEVKNVARLHEKFKRTANSNIKIANMEILNIYAKGFGDVRKSWARRCKEIESLDAQLPYYYRFHYFNVRGIKDIGSKVDDGLQNAHYWYRKKISVGGKVPVGGWMELPRISEFTDLLKK